MNRVHAGKAIKKDDKCGAFLCDYCEETFQLSRSRSQHVRNKHAATQSARLAEESSQKTSADSQPRHWDDKTVRKFIRALFVVGTAREMKSVKTTHNVKGYKLKFLKDHPDWNTEFKYLDPNSMLSDSEDEIEEEEETDKKEGGEGCLRKRSSCRRIGDPCRTHSRRGSHHGDGRDTGDRGTADTNAK